MLKTEHRQGRTVVKMVSDITEELAIELVAHIRRLRDECFHERVELEIASNGGSVLALGYFLDALDGFRASGLEVVTRALTLAASAAADLVALGDRREAAGSAVLRRLYDDLFAFDAPISAALARELRLLDAVVNPGARESRAERPDAACRIPEWRAAFGPDGSVDRRVLCRHVLILGETGSGKTASGVLPLRRPEDSASGGLALPLQSSGDAVRPRAGARPTPFPLSKVSRARHSACSSWLCWTFRLSPASTPTPPTKLKLVACTSLRPIHPVEANPQGWALAERHWPSAGDATGPMHRLTNRLGTAIGALYGTAG